MRVKVLESDERLGVSAGEIYDAQRYWLDPHDKVTLLAREPDGYDPCCNQYKHQVAFWVDGQWCVLRGNQFVPEQEAS